MATRYGVSPWIDGVSSARRPAYPRLRGEERADVVIVGGGLTGCVTALTLSMAGARPIVIEADRIGLAGAGRHGGLLLPEPGPAFRDVQQVYGLRAGRMVFEAWRRAALDGAALLKRARVRCGLEPCDELALAAPSDEKLLRREYESRAAAGLDVSWMVERQVRQAAKRERGVGMRMRGAFWMDPYRACLGVAAAAARRGARFFERSRATKIRPMSKHVEIISDGAIVRASTVIIATGTATGEFAPLRRHFKRRETYLVLTEPIPAAVRKELPARTIAMSEPHGSGLQVSWAPDHRLLLSGADQEETPARTRDGVIVQRTGQLMYETLTRYHAISGLRPAYGWELGYGATADGLMFVGPHRNYPRHLFALGGEGRSITGAFLAARVLARAVQGSPQKADEVFAWTR